MAAALVVLALVAVVVVVWDQMLQRVTTARAFAAHDVTLRVPEGADEASVLELLRESDLVSEDRLIDLYVDHVRRPAPLVGGEYRLNASSSLVQIFETLEAGDIVTHTVVLQAGWTAERIAEALAEADIVSGPAFLRTVRDPEVARILGVPSESLDGFLMPDVYAFPRGRSGFEVARALVDRFHEAAPVDVFADAPGGVRDIVRIAGRLESAPVPPKEWRLYAGLLWNRLNLGQTLTPRRGAAEDRVVFGPSDGAPRPSPGRLRPNPGPEALRAAARPAATGARFLVRREDGGFAYCGDLDCFYEALRAL